MSRSLSARHCTVPSYDSFPLVVHVDTECDNCGLNPILGTRYRSLTRQDYDLCGACMAMDPHDEYERLEDVHICVPQEILDVAHEWYLGEYLQYQYRFPFFFDGKKRLSKQKAQRKIVARRNDFQRCRKTQSKRKTEVQRWVLENHMSKQAVFEATLNTALEEFVPEYPHPCSGMLRTVVQLRDSIRFIPEFAAKDHADDTIIEADGDNGVDDENKITSWREHQQELWGPEIHVRSVSIWDFYHMGFYQDRNILSDMPSIRLFNLELRHEFAEWLAEQDTGHDEPRKAHVDALMQACKLPADREEYSMIFG